MNSYTAIPIDFLLFVSKSLSYNSVKKPFLLHSTVLTAISLPQLSTRSIDLDSASIPYGALSAKNLFAPTLPLYPLLDKHYIGLN